MVTIVGYKQRVTDEGAYFMLELEGSVVFIQSQSGSFYATARKAYIPATMNAEGCKAAIGTKLPGDITKVPCEPYEYTIEDTGEKVILNYNWRYQAPESSTPQLPTKEEEAIQELLKEENMPSKNGIHQAV